MAFQLLNFRNPNTGSIIPAAYLRAGRISLDKDNLAATVILKIFNSATDYNSGFPALQTLMLSLLGTDYQTTFEGEGSSSIKHDDAIIADVYSNLPTNPLTETLLAGSTVVS